jgi:hypothetical protein
MSANVQVSSPENHPSSGPIGSADSNSTGVVVALPTVRDTPSSPADLARRLRALETVLPTCRAVAR